MKNLYLIVLFFFTISCGYPDIDNVPDFKNIKLSMRKYLTIVLA